ncbi:hypothetical protein RLIN73S_02203 [Rhodanobacter lindaniclasticus]
MPSPVSESMEPLTVVMPLQATSIVALALAATAASPLSGCSRGAECHRRRSSSSGSSATSLSLLNALR